jgi:ATP-dependent DNA helicase RecG
MSIERVKRLLRQREHISLEFKVAVHALPGSLFETVCAMLNRDGGDILLGVNNDGVVVGVDSPAADKMITDLVNLSNDPGKLDPPYILFPQKHLVDGKTIIHIQVPASSMVHKTISVIYDRSNDGDFKLKGAQQIAELFNRKRTHYTENVVYPFLQFDDLNADLFPKIRNLIRSNNANHPWLALNDQQLLKTAGLWKKDYQTGQEGYTLAAALLLGKDEIIQHILPHYKIDALVKIQDVTRYDDRLYIQTNLIDAYEQLMGFVEKHLPDKFFLQGDQRVSLRTGIFREVAANVIVHREYTNAHPCTFVIRKSTVETENANNPHGEGIIDPENFTPFPKNPVIAKFFIQLGRVDELGSGVLNVTRMVRQYAGGEKPDFEEGPTFRMKIPIPLYRVEGINEGESEGGNASKKVSVIDNEMLIVAGVINHLVDNAINEGEIEGINEGIRAAMVNIIKLVIDKEGIQVSEMVSQLGKSKATVERYLKKMRDLNFIRFIGARKSGGYQITDYLINRITQNDFE